MHKNKVVQILRALPADRIRLLEKFVQSPAHNSHRDVVTLFLYLRKHLHKGEKALRKESVFAHLFPGEPFEMQRVHYVSSYLLRVVEEFLAWQEWRNRDADYQLSLLRSLRELRMEGHFDFVFDQAQKTEQKAPLGIDGLFFSHQLEMERVQHDRLKIGKQEFRLQETSRTLDLFFVANKLRNACILLSNQMVSKTSYDMGLLGKVLDFLDGNPMLEHPLVSLYFLAYRTLHNMEDDPAFRQLKNLLVQHRHAIEVDELHDVYIFAINYCIRRLNSGEQDFMADAFDIYKMGLEINAFLQHGVMTARTYSNITMSGLKLREFEWVEAFIFKYKDTIPEKHRDGYFNYNLSRLYYEQKRFRDAMPLLLQMEYDDALLTCLGKILLAKMHYELDEFDSLYSHLQSFRTYVLRKKLPGNYQEGTLGFISFLTKLVQRTPGAADQIRQDLLETKIVTEKEWLLGQLV